MIQMKHKPMTFLSARTHAHAHTMRGWFHYGLLFSTSQVGWTESRLEKITGWSRKKRAGAHMCLRYCFQEVLSRKCFTIINVPISSKISCGHTKSRCMVHHLKRNPRQSRTTVQKFWSEAGPPPRNTPPNLPNDTSVTVTLVARPVLTPLAQKMISTLWGTEKNS
jgi:hypothetical protein